MAIGVTPKYETEILLEDYSAREVITLATLAAKKLNWNTGLIAESGFSAFTKMSMSSWSEEFSFRIEADKAFIKSECTGNQLFDFGKNRNNVEAFLSAFNELKIALSKEELATKSSEIIVQAHGNDEMEIPLEPSRPKLYSFLSIFIPVAGYRITPVLIIINIAIFLLMCLDGVNAFNPDTESLIAWGANFKLKTLDGEWWRLLTSCFLHIGLFHLLFNMYALMYVGILLEPVLGSGKFVLAYLLAGLAASTTSIWWHDFTVSAGASGAIFGLYGLFLALLTTNYIEKAARSSLLSSILIFVVYNLFYGMTGSIDNAAHIGGLVSGLFIGYCYFFTMREKENKTLETAVLFCCSVVIIFCTAAVYSGSDNDLKMYTDNLTKFQENEEKALEVYNLPADTDRKLLLRKIKEGKKLWFENSALLKKSLMLKVPEYHQQRTYLLLKYTGQRINSFNILGKAVEENTDRYQPVLQEYNEKIGETLAVLNEE